MGNFFGDLFKSINPLEGFGAAIGLIGGDSSNRAQRRAAEAQARATLEAAKLQSDTMLKLAAPYLGAAKYAIPHLQSFGERYLEPQLGKDSELLKAQHTLNEGNILKSKRVNDLASGAYWASKGNVGRGRGESLRIDQAATDSLNTENLNYGFGQEQYRDRTLGRYGNFLNTMIGVGQTGLQPAMGAASALGAGMTNAAAIQAGGAIDAAKDRSFMYGDLGGWLRGIPQQRKDRKFLEEMYANNNRPISNAYMTP